METCTCFLEKQHDWQFSSSTQKWFSENTIQSQRTNYERVSKNETIATYVFGSVSEIM